MMLGRLEKMTPYPEGLLFNGRMEVTKFFIDEAPSSPERPPHKHFLLKREVEDMLAWARSTPRANSVPPPIAPSTSRVLSQQDLLRVHEP